MLRVRFEKDADVPFINHSEVSTHNIDIFVWTWRVYLELMLPRM